MAELTLTRRRTLTLLAVAAAVPAMPKVLGRSAQHASATWSGTALGADARLIFAGTSARAADRHVALALAEVARLEQIFSLYRSDSELSTLNAQGYLHSPSPELLQVLHVARCVHEASDGLFDPTVETVWRQSRSACNLVRAETSFAHLRIGTREISLPDGVALTLNGIAQGYITDRVTELLRRSGYRSALIDMGEMRVLTDRANTPPWRVALSDGGPTIGMTAGALATSSADTLMLCREKGIAHIIDPHTGATPQIWQSVSVRHQSATWADALSTALFLAPAEAITRITDQIAGAAVFARTPGGLEQTWNGKTET